MSTNLYWMPPPKEPRDNTLPDELKHKLAPRLWQHDGSLLGEEREIGQQSVSYLQGLADCGVEGADDLLEAIQQHGAVRIWIAE